MSPYLTYFRTTVVHIDTHCCTFLSFHAVSNQMPCILNTVWQLRGLLLVSLEQDHLIMPYWYCNVSTILYKLKPNRILVQTCSNVKWPSKYFSTNVKGNLNKILYYYAKDIEEIYLYKLFLTKISSYACDQWKFMVSFILPDVSLQAARNVMTVWPGL